jgi:two-component system LytT family response regulator/two-component system response regulator LytT
MRSISVLIVDDEPLMCEELRSQLAAYPEIEVLAVCHNGEEALARSGELNPDAMFLDIQMPGISGLNVADVLSRQVRAPRVVFLTAHDEFALKAFTVDALDYVLKPFDEDDIGRVIAKLKRYFQALGKGETAGPEPAVTGRKTDYTRKFCVQQGGKLEVIDQEQIQLIYAKDRLVFIQTTDGASHLIRFTLNEIASKLDPKRFVRCHRNYIVNVDRIQNLENWFNRGYLLVLKGTPKTEIPVSRHYVGHLKTYLEF